MRIVCDITVGCMTATEKEEVESEERERETERERREIQSEYQAVDSKGLFTQQMKSLIQNLHRYVIYRLPM